MSWGFGVMYTLATPIARSGIGLHSGQRATVRLVPEPDASRGRYFVRTDLEGGPAIAAHLRAVQGGVDLSTELAASPTARVRTVEHLLAALVGSAVAAVRLEIDGPEVPLLDGSALPWVEAIAAAGLTPLETPVSESGQSDELNEAIAPVTEPIWVRQGDAFVAALPSETLRFSYGIDFTDAAIGNQWHSWAPPDGHFQPPTAEDTAATETFQSAIAPARTFGLAHQIEHLRRNGLIQGGSLDNALVCDGDRWLNPPLRFANEPVRHKILDLVGDLSLLGTIPTAHYLAYRASHRLHGQLAQQLAARSSLVPAA
ncbi:MAG: UDP-3-O-acyl-N-acetylglucosamine deacetylase [Cyanophyceae cyanobacterium]